ncbi:Response regulator MprA [Planctomycetes bacterium CA13]|uniref:Response regulator MprA n=1 Tax=Novipirellula herctigrandis TaxID=2527986 RepID=A0A5C5Z9M3_9BACT|nr:Response regulator MprA [Planctomycetes bacterium CA13]
MHPPRILVADDSRTIRAVVYRTLCAENFDVILACDGIEAVKLARCERPHLVILDIQMPEMDGYAACEEILKLEGRRDDLPIIFLTKNNAKHLDALGNDLGAYLQKPVCGDTLLATVRSLLSRQSLAQSC